MKNESLKVAALAAILLLPLGCGGEEIPEAEPVARPVKLMTIGGLEGGVERTFPGRVSAGQQVNLAFRVGGPLIELSIDEGQAVKKGQVVARIDPRDFQIRVNSARAQFEKAEADIERLAALYEKDAASKAQLDQARAVRDVAKASLDDADADLGDTRLRAPFAANVGEKFVKNFQDVQQKEPIVSLVGLDTVEIGVDLPEGIVARLRMGEDKQVEVIARFEAAPDREFALEITELASQADPRTQTYKATLVMPQPDGLNVLPGMTAEVVARVEDSGELEQAIVIPAVAVGANDDGSSYVWVVDTEAMTTHRRVVTTGELFGTDRIRIVDGIEGGETIAVSAVSRLREGMAIRKMNE
jgi:multidrug efflux system membrane fusion protein